MKRLFLTANNELEQENIKKYKNIVLVGENLFISRLDNIPNNIKKINKCIEDHIFKLFKTDEENLFHYEKIKRSIKYTDLIIYTINYSRKLQLIFEKNSKIQIVPIQFYILKKIKRYIDMKKLILIINENNKYFVDYIENGVISKERVYDSYDEIGDINDEINFALVDNGICNIKNKKYKIY